MKNYEYKFIIKLGRAFTGVQESMYRTAHYLGLDIDITRIPSLLTIKYIVKITGDIDKIEEFVIWYNYNYVNKINSTGEQEEEI